MATAPLPDLLPVRPFFVLRWSEDADTLLLEPTSMLFAAPALGNDTLDLGDHLPDISRTLQMRGDIDQLFADRVVDTAKEFKAVQVIYDQQRIIPLFKRTADVPAISDALKFVEQQLDQSLTYVHL